MTPAETRAVLAAHAERLRPAWDDVDAIADAFAEVEADPEGAAALDALGDAAAAVWLSVVRDTRPRRRGRPPRPDGVSARSLPARSIRAPAEVWEAFRTAPGDTDEQRLVWLLREAGRL